MKGRFLIFLLIFNVVTSVAQTGRKPFSLGAKVHSGFNIPVYKALGYIIENDINALDLSLSFQTTGKDYWEKLYNYPRTGIGYSYWTLGNDEILGRAHSIYGFINVPFTAKPRLVAFNLQASAGGAYLTRKFDINENPLNRAIGSNYNIYIRLGMEARMKISPWAEILSEAGMTHFSNGKTHSPNYGINAMTISVGVNTLLNQNYLVKEDPDMPVPDNHLIHTIFISAGTKVYDNLFGKKYMSGTVSYNLEKYINHTGRAGIGADLFYDGSIAEALSENGEPEEQLIKLIRAGVHVSYAFRYKKALAGADVGFYLYSKKIVLTSIYNKIFIQYLFSRHVSGKIAIRSHWGKADCMEYGLGYSW